jgi:hypothetical protein
MDEVNQGSPFHAGDRGLLNGGCSRLPQGSIDQTPFSKYVAWSQDGNDSLFAARRRNHQLHIAILNVKHRISRIPLRINGLPVLVLAGRLLSADPFEKVPGIKGQCMPTHA